MRLAAVLQFQHCKPDCSMLWASHLLLAKLSLVLRMCQLLPAGPGWALCEVYGLTKHSMTAVATSLSAFFLICKLGLIDSWRQLNKRRVAGA